MSEREAGKKILEILWEVREPIKSREIAEKMGLNVRSSTMHLLRHVKAGYVFTPKKGYYTITEKGKEEIGLPRIDKAKALALLSPVPIEKAFHFHTGINQYLGIYANSLNDFREKIQTIDLKSIEFHLPRGDFEFWFHDLGDQELTKRIVLISKMGFSGEGLRKKVYETIKDRCEELTILSHGAHEAYLIPRKT